MRKIYVFLTYSIVGITGGPSYVNNKCKWLMENGWEVFPFDNHMNSYTNIIHHYLLPYQNNRIKELYFQPHLLTDKQQTNVFKKILNTIHIQKGDTIVVESNSPILAEWGELFSQSFNAKHLVYIIGENIIIKDKVSFNYFKFKLDRNELFFINEQAVSYFFQDFIKINNPQKYFWDATSSIMAENTSCDISMPEHDYVITYFGRYKTYFETALNEIIAFSHIVPNQRIVFLIVGEGFDKKRIQTTLKTRENIILLFAGPFFPIPQRIFDISDIVIANAGCAHISFASGAKTITMDAITNTPIGLLGYTTRNDTYADRCEEGNEISLCKWLIDILLKNKYNKSPLFNPYETISHSYDYQISFINENKKYWEHTFPNTEHANRINAFYYNVIVGKFHLLRFAAFLRYIRFKIFDIR